MSAGNPGRKKLRLTIGTKLVSLIAFLLLSSVVILVWLSTNMFIEDNTALIQQMNSDAAGSLATRMRETFQDITDKMRMLGTVLVQDAVPADVRSRVAQEFFAKDHDFLAVLIHKGANSPTPTRLPAALSPELAAAGDADGVKTLAALSSEKEFSIDAMSRGVIQLVVFHLPDGTTALAVGVPFIAAEEGAVSGNAPRFTYTLTAVIRQSKFLKAVNESDTITSYMVDQRGRLLAHPDTARAAATEDVSQTGIVRMMLEGKAGNGQTRYPDPQSAEWRLGSFRLVGFGGLGIVSEVPEAKAFEAAQSVKRRSMYFALIILSAAFLAGYLFSNTISKRIKKLVDAAHQISLGDFAIDLKPKGGDEVSTLSLAFNDMAKGLEERDRVKETFNKFHNKEIADKLLSGEVKLGGERKEATIFFSDVRGFTAMSESMEPEQVVEMLNEYMTRMVAIIRAHNGIVDKYVGDAIMAIWGVPLSGEDDALNAVKACIAMRSELAVLNELRISRGQNALRIGMGLNTGSVIAGNIGSNEKMEYTVIGDSVNLASRMESMTKEYGTDLLVPKVIQQRLERLFIFQQCKSAKVKGKSQPIEVFKVRGYIDVAGNEVIVETPYSSYESEKSDKSVHEEPKHEPQEEPAQESVFVPSPESAPLAFDLAPPPELSSGSGPVPPPPSAAAIEASRSIQRPALSLSAEFNEAPAADDQHFNPFELPEEWFVQEGTEALGPFTKSQLQSDLEKQKYSPTTVIANNREGPWEELGAHAGFASTSVPAPMEPASFDPQPPREEVTSTVIRARPRATFVAAAPPVSAPPAHAPPPAPPPYRGPAPAAAEISFAALPAAQPAFSVTPPSVTPPAARAKRRKPRPVGSRTNIGRPQTPAPAAPPAPISVPSLEIETSGPAAASIEIAPLEITDSFVKKAG